jgi:hypothetical protein
MSCLDDTFERIDAANADDPEKEEVDGETIAKAVLYGRRMTDRLETLRPDASEALKIACRAQHIRRFEVPRESYPMDRAGYHRWRTDLAKRHAEHAAGIMAAVGYDEETIERTKRLLRKKDLAKDPEAQTLEDVACLVFLEHYYAPFIADKEDDKVIVILQKTWKKMSETGRTAAKEIPLAGRPKTLLAKALA